MTATLICCREPALHGAASTDRWTRLSSPEAGADALCERCGQGCAGKHLVAFVDRLGHPHVVGTPPPLPPPLAEELARLYGPPLAEELARLYGPPLAEVESWPSPAEWNEDLNPPVIRRSPLPEREERAALLRGKQGLPPVAPTSPHSDVPAPAAVPVPRPVIAGYGPLLKPPPRTCAVDGCEEVYYARSFCVTHYVRDRRRLPPLLTTQERFFSKVRVVDDCWLWTGCTSGGYGRFFVGGESIPAQKYAWEISVGPIADGLELGHRNDCPKSCVSPSHWALATHQENNQYAAQHPSPEDRRWKPQPEPPADRFWSRVDKPGEHWLWLGAKSREGYGVFWNDGRVVAAHRFAWELLVGPVPAGVRLLRDPGCPALRPKRSLAADDVQRRTHERRPSDDPGQAAPVAPH